jgi:hypothetical protein
VEVNTSHDYHNIKTNPTEQLTKQLQQFSIQHKMAIQTTTLVSPPTKTSDVHTVQSTNPKATQQPEGKKKQRNKGKGDKKPTDNVGGDNTEKWKVRNPCNLCAEDHLTYLCPRLAETQKFVMQQQPLVLTNPFQHGQNLTQASASMEGGNQGPSLPSNNPTSMNVYMVKGDSFISTIAHDYSKPSTSEKGKEAELPSLPLQIEKTLGSMKIPKGAFKKSFHNPN